MSCTVCDQAQEPDTNTLSGLRQATWVRVGNGNVLVSGCEKHLKEHLGKEKVSIVNHPVEPII